MKLALTIVLLGSLTANAALLLAIRASKSAAVRTIANTAATPIMARRDARPVAERAAGEIDGRAEVPSRPRGSTWPELQSDDLPTLLSRLREAGFPPRVVRAIVVAAISERFNPRFAQIFYGDSSALEYWKTGGGGGLFMDRPEQRTALTQLNREREELTKKLLGAAEFDDEMAMAYQRREYGDLSPEKMGKVRDLMNDYADRRRKIIPDGRIALPDETEKLRALDAERDGNLQRLLSPAEFDQYELRRSNTAAYLGNQVQGFGATEAEYRELFGIYRPFVDQYVLNAWTADTPEQQAARKIAEEQLQPAIKAVLGDDRYADFKQAVNPEYRELNQVVGRLGLPLSVARDVAAIQQDVNQRAAALRSDTSNPEQRQAQLAALAQEANARVATALGARGVEAYKLYGGQWLDTIAKAPPAPKR